MSVCTRIQAIQPIVEGFLHRAFQVNVTVEFRGTVRDREQHFPKVHPIAIHKAMLIVGNYSDFKLCTPYIFMFMCINDSYSTKVSGICPANQLGWQLRHARRWLQCQTLATLSSEMSWVSWLWKCKSEFRSYLDELLAKNLLMKSRLTIWQISTISMRQQKIPEQDFSCLHKGSYYLTKRSISGNYFFYAVWHFDLEFPGWYIQLLTQKNIKEPPENVQIQVQDPKCWQKHWLKVAKYVSLASMHGIEPSAVRPLCIINETDEEKRHREHFSNSYNTNKTTNTSCPLPMGAAIVE